MEGCTTKYHANGMCSFHGDRFRRHGNPFTSLRIFWDNPIELGIKLEAGEKHFTDNSPTLDRIRPSKGYVKGNVQVISYLANRIKTDATAKQLMMVAKYMEKWESENE